MKIHKTLALFLLTLSLNCNNNLFATKSANHAPLSHTVEKIAAMGHLLGASAHTWASGNEELNKNTKALMCCLGAASRLASNLTTHIINMNEDVSYSNYTHAPSIVLDALELIGAASIFFNPELLKGENEESLPINPTTDEPISSEDFASLHRIARQFTALGEGASVIAASFLRDSVAPISLFGKYLSAKSARKLCYTLSSIMRSGNLLLATKPSGSIAVPAVILVAYSAILLYQLSDFKQTDVSKNEDPQKTEKKETLQEQNARYQAMHDKEYEEAQARRDARAREIEARVIAQERAKARKA